jgi:hypothetical protein
MTSTQLEIVTWSEGRLAITGSAPESSRLAAKLRESIPVTAEHWKGDSFTFSFPERHRREVVRIVEGLE